MQLDADTLGEGIAGLVRAHVAQSVAPLLKRIAELEARAVPDDSTERLAEALANGFLEAANAK